MMIFLHNTLYKGVEFLENNRDYKTVLGKYYYFKDNFDGAYTEQFANSNNKDLNFDASTNARLFFSDLFQLWWTMTDKKSLIKYYQILTKCKFRYSNFYEIMHAALCCAEGGIKVFLDIWGVRMALKCEFRKGLEVLSNIYKNEINFKNHAFAHYYQSKAYDAMALDSKIVKVHRDHFDELANSSSTWREYAKYFNLS